MGDAALGQHSEAIPVAGNQRFFLGSRPSLHLSFGCNRIGDRFEVPRENQTDRPSLGRIAVKRSGVVFGDTDFDFLASRPDVVASVRTA
jgi:hypothetical protein